MLAVVLVIDSFGIGELPDAGVYGDSGANTALGIARSVPGKKWPVLRSMGLGNCSALLGNVLPGCEPVDRPSASWGVMMEASPGKDTTTGHWELAGIVLEKPFHVFRQEHPSFPRELREAFERETGTKILGDKAASGTAIIEEMGEEHLATGNPICYTSADSVFQIAAHEEKVPIEELYRWCAIARRLVDPLQVGRVIARPFVGKPGSFTRTRNRRDFSIALPGPSVLDDLSKNGVHTVAVGKIGNIFNESGIAESHHDAGNQACLERTLEVLGRCRREREFVFVNLVDTDMIYGHRRDAVGYCRAVEEIDASLGKMLPLMGKEDLLVVTADHGCDPTFGGTDHTREHVPLLVFGKGGGGRNLGRRSTFADLAASLRIFFGLGRNGNGTNFLGDG